MIVKALRMSSSIMGLALGAAPAFAAQMPPYPAASLQTLNVAVDPGGTNWNGVWERTNNTPSGLGWDTRPPPATRGRRQGASGRSARGGWQTAFRPDGKPACRKPCRA